MRRTLQQVQPAAMGDRPIAGNTPLPARRTRPICPLPLADTGGRIRAVDVFRMPVQAFDCVTCGACCFSRNPRYLVLLPEDATRPLPPDQLFEEGGRTFMDFSCGHCAHLKLEAGQALCSVYENRPEACRAFRAGSFERQRAIRANGVMGERVREIPAVVA
jgi:uncharacterized protein